PWSSGDCQFVWSSAGGILLFSRSFSWLVLRLLLRSLGSCSQILDLPRVRPVLSRSGRHLTVSAAQLFPATSLFSQGFQVQLIEEPSLRSRAGLCSNRSQDLLPARKGPHWSRRIFVSWTPSGRLLFVLWRVWYGRIRIGLPERSTCPTGLASIVHPLLPLPR